MKATGIAKPVNALGEFFVLSAESLGGVGRRQFAWRERVEQIWFLARVSIFPAIMPSIPYTVAPAQLPR
jgi:phospholipid/cholesterol/gamma-HCH transport system permease protein